MFSKFLSLAATKAMVAWYVILTVMVAVSLSLPDQTLVLVVIGFFIGFFGQIFFSRAGWYEKHWLKG